MYNNRVLDDYFDWLYSKVKRERPSRRGSYKKLLVGVAIGSALGAAICFGLKIKK